MVIGLKSSIEASITRWEMNHERPLSHLFEETWIIKESKIHNHFHNRKEYFSRSSFFSNPLDKIIFTQFIYGNVRDLLLIRFAYRSIREDKIDFFSFLILTFRNQFRLDLSYLDKPYENDCPRSSNIYFDNLNFELPEIGIFRHSRKCKFLFDLFTDFSNIHPTQTLFRSSWLANSDHLFIFLCASSEESAVSFLIVWNKKCETFRKLSANRSNLPPSVEKWKSVFPRAEIFPTKEWRNAGGERGEKINALRPRRGIDWSLSSVRESRSSRRFRLGGAVIPLRTSRVNCRIKGKRERKKEKRGKSKNDGGTSDADAPTRRIYTRCLRERLCSKLFWNLENLNRSDPFFLFSFSHLSIRNRVGTGRTKELLIIRNLRNIYSFLRV